MGHLRDKVSVERAVRVVVYMQRVGCAADEPLEPEDDLAATREDNTVQELKGAVLDVWDQERKAEEAVEVVALLRCAGPVL